MAAMLALAGPLAAEQSPANQIPSAERSEQMQQKAIAQGLYEIAYSARQNAVFVASSGGRGEGAEAARVFRLNPETLAVEAEIPLPGKGFGLSLDDAQDRLYVGDASDPAITVIDTERGAVIDVVRLAEKPKDGEEARYHFRELLVDSRNHRLYAPGLSFADSALYVVDTASLTLEKVVPGFGFVTAGIALDPATDRLFVSNMQGQIITLDTKNLQITAKTETAGDQLLNLAFDPAKGRLFATDQGHEFFSTLWAEHLPDYKARGQGNQVLVVDAESGKDLSHLPSGQGPIALLLDPERHRLYVTNRGDRTLAVFDSETYALIERIALPAHPNSLALDAKANVLYVTLKRGDEMEKTAAESVVRIAF